MPKRFQLRRTKGWRKPEGAVVVARPTLFGNPFIRPGAVPAYRELLVAVRDDMEVKAPWCQCLISELEAIRLAELVLGRLHELRGKDLCCWCRLCEKHRDGLPLGVKCPDCKPCHVDVLLELANK